MEIPLQIAARDMACPDAGPDVKANRKITGEGAVAFAPGVDPAVCMPCGGRSPRDRRRPIRAEVDILAIV